jgi:hypothetical protein
MMRVIKLFELFDRTPNKFKLVEKTDNLWKYVFKTKSKREYCVEIKKNEYLFDVWDAMHCLNNNNNHFRYFTLTEDNFYEITATVVAALKHFIKKVKPNRILIDYIPTDDDRWKIRNSEEEYKDVPYSKMNKKARAQYKYIQDIEGYDKTYFYRKTGSYFIRTLCILNKKGSNIEDIENKIFDIDYFKINQSPK